MLEIFGMMMINIIEHPVIIAVIMLVVIPVMAWRK